MIESAIIQNKNNFKRVLLESGNGVSKDRALYTSHVNPNLQKSDAFSNYELHHEKIKFDSMKHLHKKSINRFEQAMQHPQTSNADIRMRQTFHKNLVSGSSTRYKTQQNSTKISFNKVDIFKKKASIGLSQINCNKRSLVTSIRQLDKFHASILNNEHDQSGMAGNQYGDVKIPLRPIKRLDIRNSYQNDLSG